MRANIGCSNRDHLESQSSDEEAGEAHRWANQNVVEPTNGIVWDIRHLASAVLVTGSTAQQDAADYRRLGFEALGVICVADSPPMVSMLRPAR
jgi:hypothetical protein